MDSIYIVMPAYNEAANIERVVMQWYPILHDKSDKSRLVIADSGSTDDTHDILKKLQIQYPQIDILENTERQHGPKLIALYKYAISQGATYIFQTDSDGQTNPAEFDAFWNIRNKHDAIIGHRTERGDGKDRAFVEKVVCLLLRLYFGVKVPDANAPFRLMKSSLVEKYIGRFDDSYLLPNIMLTTFFAHYKENISFSEISFGAREKGKNSINILSITKIGLNALFDFARFKKTMK